VQDDTDSDRSRGARGPRRASGREPFFPEGEREQVAERLYYIARRRYHFREQVAANLAEATLDEYLGAYAHYADWVDHPIQLVAILRGKCREHVRRQICLAAQRNVIRDAMPGVDVPTALAAGALDEIASRDARQLILEALLELRPKALEALQSLRRCATRIDLLDVIERLGFHQPSDASSLSAYQTHFRDILSRRGIRL